MTQDTHTDINLLPNKEFEEESAPKKLYLWMIGVGRLLVISTEMVAVLVWLSRFRLDYEITNLQKNIEEKANLVSHSNRYEENLRQYQNKTEALHEILNEKTGFSQGLTQIKILTPSAVALKRMNIQPGEIRMLATASSGSAFATLIASLTSSESIDRVALSQSRLDTVSGKYLVELNLAVNERLFQ